MSEIVKVDIEQYPDKDPIIFKEAKALTEEEINKIETKIKEEETQVSIPLKPSSFSKSISIIFSILVIISGISVFIFYSMEDVSASEVNTIIVNNSLQDKIASEKVMLDSRLEQTNQMLYQLKHNKDEIVQAEIARGKQSIEDSYISQIAELKKQNLPKSRFESLKKELESEREKQINAVRNKVEADVAQRVNDLNSRVSNLNNLLEENQKNIEQFNIKEQEMEKNLENTQLQLERAEKEREEFKRSKEKLEQYKKQLEEAEKKAAELHQIADKHFDNNDYRKAYDTYEKILVSYVYSRSNIVAQGMLNSREKILEMEIKEKDKLGISLQNQLAEEEYKKYDLKVKNKDYLGAVKIGTAMLKLYPDSTIIKGNKINILELVEKESERFLQSMKSSIEDQVRKTVETEVKLIYNPIEDATGTIKKAENRIKREKSIEALKLYFSYLVTLPFENLSKQTLDKANILVDDIVNVYDQQKAEIKKQTNRNDRLVVANDKLRELAALKNLDLRKSEKIDYNKINTQNKETRTILATYMKRVDGIEKQMEELRKKQKREMAAKDREVGQIKEQFKINSESIQSILTEIKEKDPGNYEMMRALNLAYSNRIKLLEEELAKYISKNTKKTKK